MHEIARLIRATVIGLPILFMASMVYPQSDPPTTEELAAQISALKQDYESRIAVLEARLASIQAKSASTDHKAVPASKPSMLSSDNTFNPAIGVVLNGMISEYSETDSSIPAFQFGHESERPEEGLTLGHSEITVSSNIDDKFYGNLTLGLGVHAGEPTELELEEAYIQTLPGAGLPDGMRIKAGRALWTLGYLNELHVHGDDFSDRPLPYRAYLDNAYNDDGLEVSFVLPGDLYSEIGAGIFRGDDTPFAGSRSGREAWSTFARLGGDIGNNSAWRIGGYILDGEARNRAGAGHAHAEDDGHGHDEEAHEDEEDEHGHENGEEHEEHDLAEFLSDGSFTGDSRLYGIDFRYTLAPTGNARDRELILQGEYFRRDESGEYELQEEHEECVDPADPSTCEIHMESIIETLSSDSEGWYAQAVYKFLPRWRVGARYSRLSTPDDAELSHDPHTTSAMIDWTNSEFGRIRLQYSRESLARGYDDDQFMLQYIMSLGAHAAHSF
ncbi:MAG: TonB-dependent receptor [Gammaproteobacteria bacterium]|nr:TonB-dependent receptor [Gammaproteobacteria bacterium]